MSSASTFWWLVSSRFCGYAGSVQGVRVIGWVVLAGLVAWMAPALPALIRYGALPHKGETVNVVLAGMDIDYDWSASTWPYPAKPLDFTTRTDTLMLAQMHPDGQVNMLSIPRDSWVNIPGWGYGKINGANVHGGPEMLQNTLRDLTGVQPDGYLFLSLTAVRDLTNAVGGVTVDVPSRMKYDDNAGHLHIDLQPGRQRLNGEQAEGFLRFRHDNLSDIGRVGRQQMFMAALSDKLRNPVNWWRLPMVAGALNRNTKSNLTRAQVGALLGAVLSGPKINTHTVPGEFGRGGTWVVDRTALASIMTKSFVASQFQPAAAVTDLRSLRITLVNVAAPDGSARRLKARLEGEGFRQVSIAEEPRGISATTISGAQAQAMQAYLGYGREGGTPLPGADLTVRLGSDAP